MATADVQKLKFIFEIRLNHTEIAPGPLLATLAHSFYISIPAGLSVGFGSFQPVRGLQDTPSHDDDIRAFFIDNVLWAGVLLAQHITCKRRERHRGMGEMGEGGQRKGEAPECSKGS